MGEDVNALQTIIDYVVGRSDPETEVKIRQRLQDPNSQERRLLDAIHTIGESAFGSDIEKARQARFWERVLDEARAASEGFLPGLGMRPGWKEEGTKGGQGKSR